jgi:hypothetical protein
MSISNYSTVTPAKNTPLLSAIGFFISVQILNFRVLAGALSALILTIISMIFNYEFGKMLASDTNATKHLLPVGYACLDIGALFIGGYIGLYAKKYLSKTIGICWLIILTIMSLFTAYSYQIATDSQKLSETTTKQINALESQIKRLNDGYVEAMDEKKKTKYHKRKDIYQAQADKIYKQLQEKEKQLEIIQASNVKPEYAVFYNTPILKNNPKQNMTIVRFIFSSAIIFTPLIILYLMGIEREKIKRDSDQQAIIKKTFSDTATPKRLQLATLDETTYKKIKHMVVNGEIKPTTRAIDRTFTISANGRQQALKRLCDDGVLMFNNNRYFLK